MLSSIRLTLVAAAALLAIAPSAAAQLPVDLLPDPPVAVAVAPVPNPAEKPVVSGAVESGSTLSCTNGGWLVATPTRYERVWLRGATVIDGSSSQTTDAGAPASYRVTEQDVGSAITCRVTAYNGDQASLPADSLPTTAAVLGTPHNLAPPSVTPAPVVQLGETATCNAGTWLNGTGQARSYDWQRDGVKVADGQQYPVSAADAGSLLTCTERVGTAAAQSTPVVVSGVAVTPPLPVKPVNVFPPTINGTPQEGRTLTCEPGLWLNEPTSYAYGWKRDGADIASATTSSYVVAAADVGHPLTCTATASNAQGASAPATSLPVLPVGAGLLIPVNQSPPTISGTARPGQQLTCSPGTWSPADVTYAYQWESNGGPLAGATNTTYLVRDADVGARLTCAVTASTLVGSSRASSASVTPTATPTAAPKPASVTPPVLTGRPVVGQSLWCSRGTWSANPTAFHVRWIRDGKLIAGAQQSSYKLQAADVGRSIGCAVIAGNSAGFGGAVSQRMRAQGAPAAVDRTRPVVTRFRSSRAQFVAGQRKTVLAWRLSEPAWVRIVVARKVAGRRSGGRCVRATRALVRKGARRCTIWKRATTLVAPAGAGAGKLPFTGKVGKRVLRPGRYRLSLTAVDAAKNKSAVRRLKITLKAPRKRTA